MKHKRVYITAPFFHCARTFQGLCYFGLNTTIYFGHLRFYILSISDRVEQIQRQLIQLGWIAIEYNQILMSLKSSPSPPSYIFEMEEEARSQERTITAFAKTIAALNPDLGQAGPLPGSTPSGSPGGGSPSASLPGAVPGEGSLAVPQQQPTPGAVSTAAQEGPPLPGAASNTTPPGMVASRVLTFEASRAVWTMPAMSPMSRSWLVDLEVYLPPILSLLNHPPTHPQRISQQLP
jgi:hypothetical protein